MHENCPWWCLADDNINWTAQASSKLWAMEIRGIISSIVLWCCPIFVASKWEERSEEEKTHRHDAMMQRRLGIRPTPHRTAINDRSIEKISLRASADQLKAIHPHFIIHNKYASIMHDFFQIQGWPKWQVPRSMNMRRKKIAITRLQQTGQHNFYGDHPLGLQI